MPFYADFLAFPFCQDQLLEKKTLTPPDSLPDLIHVTSVPPFVQTTEEILAEHAWFVELLRPHLAKHGTRVVYGLQHPPFDATPEGLERMRAAGISVMSLAYELENKYGGGFAAPTAKLTKAGVDLIEMMDDADITLDLSHAGHQTAKDALMRIPQQPGIIKVCASHGGCHAVHPHLRNLTDDVLEGIAHKDGGVGLTTTTWMLSGSNDGMGPFFAHLNHLLDVVGDEHIAIGSDAVYRHIFASVDHQRFEALKGKLDHRGNFRPRWPEQPAELRRADRLVALDRLLERRRYQRRTIDKILGLNLANFLNY